MIFPETQLEWALEEEPANYQLIRETFVVYAISVRSFWGILSKNLMKIGKDRAKIKAQFYLLKFKQIHIFMSCMTIEGSLFNMT